MVPEGELRNGCRAATVEAGAVLVLDRLASLADARDRECGVERPDHVRDRQI